MRVLGWPLAGEHTKMSAALKITVGYDGKIFGRNGKNERKKKLRHDPKKNRARFKKIVRDLKNKKKL